MENGLQNGLKCILRDVDFKKKFWGTPDPPPTRKGSTPLSYSPPARGLRRSVQAIDFQCPPVINPSGSSPALQNNRQPHSISIIPSLYLEGSIQVYT